MTSQTTYKFHWSAIEPPERLAVQRRARISPKTTLRTMASAMEVPALNDITIVTGGADGMDREAERQAVHFGTQLDVVIGPHHPRRHSFDERGLGENDLPFPQRATAIGKESHEPDVGRIFETELLHCRPRLRSVRVWFLREKQYSNERRYGVDGGICQTIRTSNLCLRSHQTTMVSVQYPYQNILSHGRFPSCTRRVRSWALASPEDTPDGKRPWPDYSNGPWSAENAQPDK